MNTKETMCTKCIHLDVCKFVEAFGEFSNKSDNVIARLNRKKPSYISVKVPVIACAHFLDGSKLEQKGLPGR